MTSSQKSHIYTMVISVALSVLFSVIIIASSHFLFLHEKPKINLNNSTKNQLELLDGIGPKKAELIISNRPYASKYDIISIDGIGLDLFKEIESEVTVE